MHTLLLVSGILGIMGCAALLQAKKNELWRVLR